MRIWVCFYACSFTLSIFRGAFVNYFLNVWGSPSFVEVQPLVLQSTFHMPKEILPMLIIFQYFRSCSSMKARMANDTRKDRSMNDTYSVPEWRTIQEEAWGGTILLKYNCIISCNLLFDVFIFTVIKQFLSVLKTSDEFFDRVCNSRDTILLCFLV